MSFHTQSMKLHSAGRLWLTKAERDAHLPWYASQAWQERKQAIARKVEKRVERATLRRLEREDIAKGIDPLRARENTEKRKFEIELQKKSFFARIIGRIKNFIQSIFK